MKTTLIAILSGILAISAFGYDRQAEEEIQAWCDHQNELDESRQRAARQQAALDDIRWELAERRRQAATQTHEQIRIRRLLEQQQADRRRLEVEAWFRSRRFPSVR